MRRALALRARLRSCVRGFVFAAASSCTVDTPPLEASGDYLPLTGGHVTGDVAVSGKLQVTDATGTVPQLTIHPNGNVGIGDVAGSLLGVRAPAGHTGPLFAVSDEVGQDAFVVQDDGNVGIGTLAPAAPLEVHGRAQVTDLVLSNQSAGGSGPRKWQVTISGPGAEYDTLYFAPETASGSGVFGTATVVFRPDGRVGVGTSNPTAALDVVGTVKATAFQPPSSRTLKRDIEYLGADDYDGMLGALGRLDAAHYRYKAGLGADDHARLGFIAEDLPPDVLSADGKAVDLYELVTFVAGATKAVDRQQRQAVDDLRTENDALRERVRALEAQVATQRDLAARLARLEAAMPSRGAPRRAP